MKYHPSYLLLLISLLLVSCNQETSSSSIDEESSSISSLSSESQSSEGSSESPSESSSSSSEEHTHNLTYVEAQEASCTEEGHEAYYYCTSCNEYFLDFDGETPIDYEELVISPTGHSWGYWQNETEATCEEGGTQVRSCLKCNQQERQVTSSLDHSYLLTWEWNEYESAKAIFTCQNDSSHVVNIDAGISSEVLSNPTCEEEGLTIYTASVAFNDNTYTDTRTEEVEALGHNYELSYWTWDGYESAVATFTCLNDSKHTKEVEASISSEVSTNSTCLEDGLITYKATVIFDGEEYTDINTKAISASGHDYQLSWTWDGHASAKATFICKHDSSHVEIVDATITSQITPATCEEDGLITYIATVNFDGETYSDYQTEAVEAIGHDYVVYWSWNDVNSATAFFVCQNDSTHIQIIGASITSEVITTSTYSQTTYTATATLDNQTYTDTKTITEYIEETTVTDLSNWTMFTLGDSLSTGGVWQNEIVAQTNINWTSSYNTLATSPLSVGGTNSYSGRRSGYYRAQNLINNGYIDSIGNGDGKNVAVLIENINDAGQWKNIDMSLDSRLYKEIGTINNLDNEHSISATTIEELYENYGEDSSLSDAFLYNFIGCGYTLTIDGSATSSGTIKIYCPVNSYSNSSTFSISIDKGDDELTIAEKIAALDYGDTYVVDNEDGTLTFGVKNLTETLANNASNNYVRVASNNTGTSISDEFSTSIPCQLTYYFKGDSTDDVYTTSKWASSLSWTAAYKTMIELLMAKYPYITIILCSFPRFALSEAQLASCLDDDGTINTTQWLYYYQANNNHYETAALSTMASYYSIYHCPIVEEWGVNATNYTTYFEYSNVHYKTAGYHRIGDVISKYLYQWLLPLGGDL